VLGPGSPESGARQIKIFVPEIVYRCAPAGECHGATAAAAGIRFQRHQQVVSLEGSFLMGNMLAFLGRDMAVDLGTANTLVYVRRRGIALNEPSVVALNTDTGKIVAVGVQAKRMIGRTPGNIVAIRPLRDGVIADFDVTERMLRYFIQQVHRRRHLARPQLVVAVPSGITGVE
jgi:rod shape-determining protein MreB